MRYSVGIASTRAPLSRSDSTLDRRRPTRSISVPAKAAETTTGSVEAKAASPVRAALPVDSRTNHGTASIESTLPVRETVFADSRTTSGRITQASPVPWSPGSERLDAPVRRPARGGPQRYARRRQTDTFGVGLRSPTIQAALTTNIVGARVAPSATRGSRGSEPGPGDVSRLEESTDETD